MHETPEARLKRMTMRSWRRGTKEMDMILGPFADGCLAAMPKEALNRYDRLLEQNDLDLYQWVSGQAPTPDAFLDLITEISTHARMR